MNTLAVDLPSKVHEAAMELLKDTAARHANPLNFWPGNIPISPHIERMVEAGVHFVACYADLNYFKPFNDHCGYLRSDEMIHRVVKLALALFDAPARLEAASTPKTGKTYHGSPLLLRCWSARGVSSEANMDRREKSRMPPHWPNTMQKCMA